MDEMKCPVCYEVLGTRKLLENGKFEVWINKNYLYHEEKIVTCPTCQTAFKLKTGIDKGLILILEY